jgi:hypothetical protein
MAGFTFRLSQSLSVPGGTLGGAVETFTGDGVVDADVTIATGVEQQVVIAFTRAATKCIGLLSSKNVTVRTNAAAASPETAGDIVALTAGKPVIWDPDQAPLVAHPFPTADVTTLYVQNNSGAETRFQIYVLRDATP